MNVLEALRSVARKLWCAATHETLSDPKRNRRAAETQVTRTGRAILRYWREAAVQTCTISVSRCAVPRTRDSSRFPRVQRMSV